MTSVPTDIEAARAALAAAPGVPVWLDVPVIATKQVSRSGPSKLVLRLGAEDGTELGRADVYNREWYPGVASRDQRFSHYFLALARCFEGLERAGHEPTLRLQLLRAVRAVTPSGQPLTVLLKFIIAPEYALTGRALEAMYGCPLANFYEGFVGVSREVLRDRTTPSFTRGNAIHAGYRAAADAFVRSGDRAAARAAYLDGVRRSWIADFAYLLLDRPKGKPTKLHTAPLAAADAIVALCTERWEDEGTRRTLALLQERLLFAPSRGVSGRADRIEERRGLIRLSEVKTGGGFGAEKDPASGKRRAGGVQALAYRAVLDARGAGTRARTASLGSLNVATERGAPMEGGEIDETALEMEVEVEVEELEDGKSTRVALGDHPVLLRAGATLAPHDERALDLLAQGRNVAYAAATGLLTGYDRHRLDGVGRANRFLQATGGDWSLYASSAPCQICAVAARGVCEQSRRPVPAPLHNLFRYAPPELFAYWAWFHRQLRAEDRAGREWLYHLATTPPETLERQEGVTLSGLRVRDHDGPVFRFGREAPLETRVREDDRVLLTPAGLPPGDARSVEGTVERLDRHEVVVRLRDRLDGLDLRYRLDDVGRHDMSDWQTQGLTDFLVSAMDATPARGRAIAVEELPPLARTLLGAADLPPLPADPPVPAGVKGLNDAQRRAVGAVLALDPARGEPLLVQGPPGTGKTAMIAELARAILAQEFTWDEPGSGERPLLLLANSHRAVDEVIGRLATRFPELRPYLVRVGSPRAGMEPTVRACVMSERLGVEEALTGGDLEEDGAVRLVALIREGNVLHDQAAVFAGTLAAATRPELRGLAFRTVIVDETGQATEPAALQALRHLPAGYRGRLVLVGDHQQLPPVVTQAADVHGADGGAESSELPPELAASGLRAGGTLRTSMFERLVGRYSSRLITLTDQYRMAAPISKLVSETFYGGALRPGTPEVAARRIAETYAALALSLPPTSLVAGAPPVLLVDTSGDPTARDTVAGFAGEGDEARDNDREAKLVARLVADLFAGVPPSARRALATEVGVISPYRRQNNRIRQALGTLDPLVGQEVRVDTVDRFQGGERDVIVVSLTNSNPAGTIGSLHADWRRMNVALSRARRALVIIGDRGTFTRRGRPEEEPAKEVYRRLFAGVDRLAERGAAAIVASETLRP